MTEVERLEDELALAKAKEKLEEARAAFHADRSDIAAKRAYRKASKQVQQARSSYRLKHPIRSEPGDGVAQPETVRAKAKAEEVAT
jgi:hypothetical protein